MLGGTAAADLPADRYTTEELRDMATTLLTQKLKVQAELNSQFLLKANTRQFFDFMNGQFFVPCDLIRHGFRPGRLRNLPLLLQK